MLVNLIYIKDIIVQNYVPTKIKKANHLLEFHFTNLGLKELLLKKQGKR